MYRIVVVQLRVTIVEIMWKWTHSGYVLEVTALDY